MNNALTGERILLDCVSVLMTVGNNVRTVLPLIVLQLSIILKWFFMWFCVVVFNDISGMIYFPGELNQLDWICVTS